jgi:hypothetical protein
MVEDHDVMGREEFLLRLDVDGEVGVRLVKVVEGDPGKLTNGFRQNPVHTGLL